MGTAYSTACLLSWAKALRLRWCQLFTPGAAVPVGTPHLSLSFLRAVHSPSSLQSRTHRHNTDTVRAAQQTHLGCDRPFDVRQRRRSGCLLSPRLFSTPDLCCSHLRTLFISAEGPLHAARPRPPGEHPPQAARPRTVCRRCSAFGQCSNAAK